MSILPNPADPGDPRHRIPDGSPQYPQPPQPRRWWRLAFLLVALIAATLIVAGIWINR